MRRNANSPTKVTRSDQEARIAKLRICGHDQASIAKEVGLTQGAVSKILSRLMKRWREETAEAVEELKALELKKLDDIEREAREAWERSKLPEQSKKTVTSEGPAPPVASAIPNQDPATLAVQRKHTELSERGQCGNDQFLGRLTKCIEIRAKLLGLDAPIKTAVTDVQGNDLHPADERRSRLAILAERLATGEVPLETAAGETEGDSLPTPIPQDAGGTNKG